MYSLQKLEIYGYQQEAVPHTFVQQHEPADHAAIVFPGLQYTCQGPVLNYPSQELLIRRADVLWVEYDQRPQFATFSPEELQQCCVTDAGAAYEALFPPKPSVWLAPDHPGKSRQGFVRKALLIAQGDWLARGEREPAGTACVFSVHFRRAFSSTRAGYQARHKGCPGWPAPLPAARRSLLAAAPAPLLLLPTRK